MIHANAEWFEKEQDGEISLALAAIEYTGSARRYNNSAVVNQGRWPTETEFTAGNTLVGFVPESTPQGDTGTGLAWFERSSDFDVRLGADEVCEALASYNYIDLTPTAADPGAIDGFDQRLQEALGLEDPLEAGVPLEVQVRERAGVDEPTKEGRSEIQRLIEENDREELKDRVKEKRESTDEFSLSGASMQDMAKFLAGDDGGDE